MSATPTPVTRQAPAAGGGLGSAMAGGNSKTGRVVGGFYPTPDDVTKALVRHYLGGTRTAHNAHVWEPCAGDGAMARVMREHGSSVLASDVQPRAAGIATLDIFAAPRLPTGYDHIITNPPFELAEKMIRHLMQIGPPKFLALVLKASFWHAKKRYPLWRQYQPQAVHPLLWRPDFQNLGGPTMEIMWCVWTNTLPVSGTQYEPLERPI